MSKSHFNGTQFVIKFRIGKLHNAITDLKKTLRQAQRWADIMRDPVEVTIFGFRVWLLPSDLQPPEVSLAQSPLPVTQELSEPPSVSCSQVA